MADCGSPGGEKVECVVARVRLGAVGDEGESFIAGELHGLECQFEVPDDGVAARFNSRCGGGRTFWAAHMARKSSLLGGELSNEV